MDVFLCPNVRCGGRLGSFAAAVHHIESEVCGYAKFRTVQDAEGNLVGTHQVLWSVPEIGSVQRPQHLTRRHTHASSSTSTPLYPTAIEEPVSSVLSSLRGLELSVAST